MTLYCGTGKIEITPKIGTPLAGYAGNKRNASEVHDPLYARVIALQDTVHKFVIISLDLVGIDKAYYQKLAEKIQQSFDIPVHHVFVHATHTHSASGGLFDPSSPVGKAFPYMNGYLPSENRMIDEQQAKILYAVEQAIHSCQPCELFFGKGRAEGIAANRNSPDQAYDALLNVVAFRFLSGKKAILYHFASHPTILHLENTAISADLPGFTSKKLEEQEDIQLALFLNGPSADISTRFTRRESTFAEVERLGKKLFSEVLKVLEKMEQVPEEPLQANETDIQLKIRKIPERQVLEQELEELRADYSQLEREQRTSPAELRQLQSRIEGVTTSLDIGSRLKETDTIHTPLSVLRIGSILLVSIPGELYFEAGQQMIQPFHIPVLIAGNTNDHLGYIVPERYYQKKHYESFMTLLEEGSNEIVVHTAIKQIGKLLSS